ncbi:MAG: TolC family protein [Candidatus Rokubacteria bacterium]|nr:TolC family protein [Candidatus Rokubacteria bacterium]
MRSRIAVLALAWLVASPALAQTPTAPSAPPPAPAPLTPATIVGRQITVEEAIAIALEGQPQIVARIAEYEAARFRVDQALSPLLPQLSGTWTAARTQSSNVVERLDQRRNLSGIVSEPSWATSTVARVSLSQLLFDFGKNFATVGSARKQADVSLEEVELQRQVISLAVKESYTNILFAQRLIRVNQQAQERAELNLRSARGFFDVGTRPKSDVTRAEVDVANARVDVIRARNAERSARVALNVAMGIPVDTNTQIVDNLAYQPATFDRVLLQAEALRQRPEYRQTRLFIESADLQSRRAYLDFFPDITGGGFYGATRADMNEIWELNLNLTWPLFDGGNRIARYRESRANLDAARGRMRAQELEIAREVEQTLIAVEETQERIQAAQKAVEAAQENFRLAQGRFDAGVGTILELTDAQLELTRAQNLEAQALADYRIALARLDRSVGRR